ncbi:MAG: glycosyltransferase family 39 protein [Candidatus Binataceae bacterium]
MLAASSAVYGYRLGHEPLSASEAYSALVASQPSIRTVWHSALGVDPGKPGLYHLLLHGLCGLVGSGEAGVRALSALFGVISVWLVFALGDELFGFEIGLSGAILWAFNPLAVIFARWARMYSMLVACTLAHLVALAKLRRRTQVAMVLLAGVLGGAMLYTHLGGILILAGDTIVMIREFRREGRSVIWPAVAIAGIMFLPFVPVAVAQSNALLFGHCSIGSEPAIARSCGYCRAE